MLPDYLYASLAYQPRANDKMFILWSLRALFYDLILADIGFMVLISQHSGFFHYQPERRDNFL